MSMRHLALVCLLALPVIAGAPKGKPPVKKVVYTVDQLIEMSGIATFTASEELTLQRCAKSPKKTLDALLYMIERRIDQLDYLSSHGTDPTVSLDNIWRQRDTFAEIHEKMRNISL